MNDISKRRPADPHLLPVQPQRIVPFRVATGVSNNKRERDIYETLKRLNARE